MENQAVAKAAPSPSSSERKMKMTQILDQGDDGEFVVQGEDARAAWHQQYLATVGGLPPEEEDPTLEQLSALHRRIFTQDTTQRRSYLVQLHSLSGGRASGFFEPPS